VLVEALTLIIRKSVLDLSFPGGTDAFLHRALHLARPPRYICSMDPELVNLSFYDPDHLTPVCEMLEEAGLVAVDDDAFCDFAIIEQRFGPTVPCDWLEWANRAEGFTVAWLTETGPGNWLAVPDDWTPERSAELTRTDIAECPDMMLLASEDGVESYLNLATGRVHEGVPADRPR
jgi:hypothetical protein